MQHEFSRLIFENKFKFKVASRSVQWEPSCSMRTYRRTDRQTDRQTDMTKSIVTIRNFANAPKQNAGCITRNLGSISIQHLKRHRVILTSASNQMFRRSCCSGFWSLSGHKQTHQAGAVLSSTFAFLSVITYIFDSLRSNL